MPGGGAGAVLLGEEDVVVLAGIERRVGIHGVYEALNQIDSEVVNSQKVSC